MEWGFFLQKISGKRIEEEDDEARFWSCRLFPSLSFTLADVSDPYFVRFLLLCLLAKQEELLLLGSPLVMNQSVLTNPALLQHSRLRV